MTPHTMRSLSVGEQVSPTTSEYTYTVLACRLLRESTNDSHAVWKVLCFLPHNDFHPFAVWTAYDNPDGWAFADGEYRSDISEALTAYN